MLAMDGLVCMSVRAICRIQGEVGGGGRGTEGEREGEGQRGEGGEREGRGREGGRGEERREDKSKNSTVYVSSDNSLCGFPRSLL